MRYRIKGIYHNGRKGPRMEPVTEEKYDGLAGCRILWDISELKQFKSTTFKIIDDFFGSWRWHTSEVLQLTKRDEKIYELETANTIYVLEELDGNELLYDD